MRHFTVAVLFAFIGLLISSRTFAQSAANGTVTGRVSNAATQKYLASAEIVDKDTKQTAYTDADGSYILMLPAGDRTLLISYGGLDSQEVKATVVESQTVTKDVVLTSKDYDKDLVKLEKFVVAGAKEGRMASIAQQKASDALVSVISSDEFPNVAGANLGEFLRNVPGIDVVDNGSDPRNISVRGMDSQTAMVTSDGMRMANAVGTSGNSRSFDLDQISIQNYETIEVYKTPVASMEAASGGGSVNLVSKSAFNLKNARMTFQAGGMINSMTTDYLRNRGSSGNEYSIRPVGNFMYQNSFFHNRLGVTFTANYNDIYTPSKNVTQTRRAVDDYSNATYDQNYPRGVYTRGMNYSYGTGFTRRTSFSLNFDYKLTPFIKLYSNNQVNTSYISSGAQNLTVGNVEIAAPGLVYAGGPSSGIVSDWTPYSSTYLTGANDVRANTIQDAANSKSGVAATTGLEVLNKIGNGTMFALGTEYKKNGWKVNVDGGFSLSTNHYTAQHDKQISQASMYLRGIDYSIDSPADSNYPILTQLGGIDMYDLGNYVSRSASGGNGPLVSIAGTNRNAFDPNNNVITIPGVSTNLTYPNVQTNRGDYYPLQVSNGRWLATKDKFTTAKFDARRTFFTKIPMYLQIGGLWREQERHTDKNGQDRWFFTGSTEELHQLLEDIKSPDLNASFGPYQAVPYFSLPYLDQYFREHPEKFREDAAWRKDTEATGDKLSRERVTAGYGMFNIKLWRITTLLGMRYERTDQYGRGAMTDNDAVAVRASQMLMDYVHSYGYSDITSAYNDTSTNPITGMTGQQMVTGYTVTPVQALELTQIRYAKFATAEKNYDGWFPNVQLKYDVTPNLVVRGSYNKAISRQGFDKLLPGYSATTDVTGVSAVTMNNPSLKPMYYDNYDVAVEYYTKKGGSWSVGYFYKYVKDFQGTVTQPLYADGVYEYDFSSYLPGNISYPVNLGDAKIKGVEVAVTQRLGVFADFLKNFMVYASYTHQDGKASTSASFSTTSDTVTGLTSRPAYMPVTNLVPNKFRVTLSYAYRRLNASLTYMWVDHYASGGPYRIGPSNTQNDFTYLYNDSRSTFDGSIQYSFYRNYRFYAEAKNIGNAPVRTYFSDSRWTQAYNIYGAAIYFGIKGSF